MAKQASQLINSLGALLSHQTTPAALCKGWSKAAQELSLPSLCKPMKGRPWGENSGLTLIYKWEPLSLTAGLLLAAAIGTVFSTKVLLHPPCCAAC